MSPSPCSKHTFGLLCSEQPSLAACGKHTALAACGSMAVSAPPSSWQQMLLLQAPQPLRARCPFSSGAGGGGWCALPAGISAHLVLSVLFFAGPVGAAFKISAGLGQFLPIKPHALESWTSPAPLL